MAKDLTKSILPIEQQQKKTTLYKNWKLYATALGVITVALAVGLGVGLGVHNSSQNTVSTTQKIVNEINNIRDYALPTINSNATLESITIQITGDFIKTKLTGDNANQFKTEAFTFNKITVGEDNHDLTTSDLVTDGSIAAKINYDYDTIINQTTSLTLTVTATTGIRSIIKVTELGTLNSNESAVILVALGKANDFDPYFNDWLFEIRDNTSNSAKVISYKFPDESVEVTFKVVIPLFQDLAKIQIPEEIKNQADFPEYFIDEGEYKPLLKLIPTLSELWDKLDPEAFYWEKQGYETVKDSNQIVWLTEEDLNNDYPLDINQRQVWVFGYDEELDGAKDSVQHKKFHLEVAMDVVYGDSYQILKTSKGILS